MWVVALGPFRGRRARTLRIVGLVIIIALLLALAWQVLDAILGQPLEVEPSTAATYNQRQTSESVFSRIIAHLRNWYREGF